MGDLTLGQALQLFKDGSNELALTRATTQAQEATQQIKRSELDESQQRQALTEVADGFVLRLTGLGVNPVSINQAARAVAPAPFKDSSELAQEAAFLGQSIEKARAGGNTERADQLKERQGNLFKQAESIDLAEDFPKQLQDERRQEDRKELFKIGDLAKTTRDESQFEKKIELLDIGDVSKTTRDERLFEQTKEKIGIVDASQKARDERLFEQDKEKLGIVASAKRASIEAARKDKIAINRQKFIRNTTKDFNSSPDITKITEGLTFSNQALALIAQDKVFVKDLVIIQRGILKLVGEGSRLSDNDIATTSAGQSFGLRTKQEFIKFIKNAAITENVEEMKATVLILRQASIHAATKRARDTAKARAKVAAPNLKVTAADLEEQFLASFETEIDPTAKDKKGPPKREGKVMTIQDFDRLIQ